MNNAISSLKQHIKQKYTQKRCKTTKVDKTSSGRAQGSRRENKSFSITEIKNTWERKDIAENPVRDTKNRSQDDSNLQIKRAHYVPGKT